ncbi:hypothetical protein ECANGB1_2386 [Enterospora canceri]|uniref:Uncharacterized protein n=1 Tax=Enterospora canceri TaxID=1081671 RepID=A0A1Y1S4S5_9MICR|nr:hypothetical protein ECANGB1_2386 [Enterospora canceri]
MNIFLSSVLCADKPRIFPGYTRLQQIYAANRNHAVVKYTVEEGNQFLIVNDFKYSRVRRVEGHILRNNSPTPIPNTDKLYTDDFNSTLKEFFSVLTSTSITVLGQIAQRQHYDVMDSFLTSFNMFKNVKHAECCVWAHMLAQFKYIPNHLRGEILSLIDTDTFDAKYFRENMTLSKNTIRNIANAVNYFIPLGKLAGEYGGRVAFYYVITLDNGQTYRTPLISVLRNYVTTFISVDVEERDLPMFTYKGEVIDKELEITQTLTKVNTITSGVEMVTTIQVKDVIPAKERFARMNTGALVTFTIIFMIMCVAGGILFMKLYKKYKKGKIEDVDVIEDEDVVENGDLLDNKK